MKPDEAAFNLLRPHEVAFTHKGGCPLKPFRAMRSASRRSCSIHPQGWVPIETDTPSGVVGPRCTHVAFTPKGGCPLKLCARKYQRAKEPGSIHPQGWVPIETVHTSGGGCSMQSVAFTPKGGCPLKRRPTPQRRARPSAVAFTPKGGCPLKRLRVVIQREPTTA